MKIDGFSSILARIYTKNENIKGVLERLEIIMDKSGYQELYNRYLEIASEIPANELLTEFEREYENFGSDLKYGKLERRLDDFESELEIYNEYKEFSDLLNKIKTDITKAFEMEFSIEDFVKRNKEFVDLLVVVKNNKTIHQFTRLFDDAINTLFVSLKTLTLVGNNELVKFIGETNSEYLREHLASLVRKSIDTVSYEGSLDEDYVDFETLYKCAVNDNELIVRQEKVKEFEERQKVLAKEYEERVAYLQNKLGVFDECIRKYQKEPKQLKLSRTGLKAKRLFLGLVAVPAIAIPLSCPFIGRHIGTKESANVLLTKTITNTVDTNSGEIMSRQEEYNEFRTDYVASVTICESWRRNASGISYVRNCVVYDYDFSDLGKLDDDFHLTLEDINPDKLVKKYSYEETTGEADINKDLKEGEQIYITETYQDVNDVKISNKFTIPFTVAGAGAGVILGTTEVAAYLYAGKRLSDRIDEKIKRRLSTNEVGEYETKKILKKTYDEQARARKEYDDLIQTK